MNAQLPLPSTDSGLRRLLFEGFELRPDSGELFQRGIPVRLQPQPARVLEVLAGRSREIVSREEIRQIVWGDAFVDFDSSLNFCIKEIRRALGDSASSPRFVETIPRRGYRFLMSVRTDEEGPSPRSWSWPRLGNAAAVLVLLVLLTFLIGSRLHRPAARDEAGGPRPSDPAAHQAYLHGLYLLGHRQYEQAADTLENAILLAPDFAPAYAELAKAKLEKGLSTAADIEATEAAARRALELDPDLAAAHLALGQILFRHHLDWEGAGRELEKAVALDPGSAEAHCRHASYLLALGRYDQAMASIARGRELDPACTLVTSDYAWFFYMTRRYEEAIRQARQTLELYPPGQAAREPLSGSSLATNHRVILDSAWKLGDRRTALAAAKALMELHGFREQAAGLRSLEDYWRGQDQWLRELGRQELATPYDLARAAVYVGEEERALDLLLEQCRLRSVQTPLIAVEPVFESLHGHPRWSQVLDCLKLPADAPVRTADLRNDWNERTVYAQN
jgi:DNA-binding winged helix-turn-helix (wHTH) protein/Tfp pilus assembly protein PilF